MRTVTPVVLMALATACGGASYAHGRGTTARVAAVAPHVVRPTTPASAQDAEEGEDDDIDSSAATVDPMEHREGLRRFFEALARLDDGRARDDVRIVQFGDSHTAADYQTGPLRRALQARFGDGGRGFLQLGRPWKWYVQEGVHVVGMTGWGVQRGHPTRAGASGDGMYGLLGVAIESTRRGARAWTDLSARAPRIELGFLA